MNIFPENREAFRAACASVVLHAVLAGLLILSISFAEPDLRRRGEAPRVLHVSWVSTETETSPEPASAGIRRNDAQRQRATGASLPRLTRRAPDMLTVRAQDAPQITEFQTVSLELPAGFASGIGLPDDGPGGTPQPEPPDRSAGNESTASAAPRYLENAHPVYPAVARSRGYAGTVLLAAEIAANGRVENLTIKKSSGYASLDRSALEAVKRWKFDPGRRMGKPVAMWVDVPVKFVLKEDDSVS